MSVPTANTTMMMLWEEKDFRDYVAQQLNDLERRLADANADAERYRTALSTVTDALIWSSGCFQSDELVEAWVKTGRLAVQVGLDALHAARKETSQ